MRRRLLLAALLLVAAVNGLVLAGVAYNRSGTPDTEITLTERELPRPWSPLAGDENTGESLELRYASVPLPWFDADKLQTVGFTLPDPVARSLKPEVARRGYVVLEYDGPAWAALLAQKAAETDVLAARVAQGTATRQQLEYARQALDRMRTGESRLVPVDVGPDPQALRVRYADRSRYLITAAELRMQARYQGPDKQPAVQGEIARILTSPIHLPVRFHATLEQALNGPGAVTPVYGYGHPPRYSVTLRYGRRLEPWITGLTPVEGDAG